MVDDILIIGVTIEEHNRYLKTVLRTIRDSCLKLNKAKCHFVKLEIQYFGHKISAEGMKLDSRKVKAITQMPSPNNAEELW